MKYIKSIAHKILSLTPEGRSLQMDRWTRQPQPKQPKAQVLLTVLTPGGVNANGKVTGYRYFSLFTKILRQTGYKTHFCSSVREVKKRMQADIPTILIHIFGEDHYQITSPTIDMLERNAVAIFNKAETGIIISDKLKFYNKLLNTSIPQPKLQDKKGFVRARLGTAEETWLLEEDNPLCKNVSSNHLVTEFIDTRIKFQNNEYYTSVRLVCVNENIIHAFTRCRDASEGDPSVHNKNTPLNPDLIEYLNAELVMKNMLFFENIAKKLHDTLGNGFYAHDLLIDQESKNIFVCESNFKFNDIGWETHFFEIKDEIPSQSIFFPMERLIGKSSRTFCTCCDEILERNTEKQSKTGDQAYG